MYIEAQSYSTLMSLIEGVQNTKAEFLIGSGPEVSIHSLGDYFCELRDQTASQIILSDSPFNRPIRALHPSLDNAYIEPIIMYSKRLDTMWVAAFYPPQKKIAKDNWYEQIKELLGGIDILPDISHSY
jgi:hypothetical protein